jgi:RNA polymerase sigma-70 factor (ECF subfamily)
VNGRELPGDGDQRLDETATREAFVRASYEGLFHWFFRLTGSRDGAADLTQEAFAAFWGSLDRVRGDVSPRTWLYAIGRNLWRNHLRNRKPLQALPEERLTGGEGPERGEEDREFREAAEHAVRALPDDLREAFTLRFWNEFGYDEIGTIQGVTAGLARWRYFAARRRLHEALAAWDPRGERAGEDRNAR